MAKVDSALRKEIIRNLHAAIDSEVSNNDQEAYKFYIESLSLVSEALKKDVTGNVFLSAKEKKNLVEFAKQSLSRITLILKKEEGLQENDNEPAVRHIYPSAPTEDIVNLYQAPKEMSPLKFNFKEADEERQNLVLRYYKRLDKATTAQERQNLELELARQLVEKAAITRNRMMQATAWAMQNAHRKFNIEGKLKGGTLKESDFKKQQLYALSLQFTEECSWLKQYLHDLSIYPNNEKCIREFLDNMFTDSTHPVKCSLVAMQSKVQEMIPIDKPPDDLKAFRTHFTNVSNEIKEDLNILHDVLTTLYEPLSTEKNRIISFEVLNHYYFSPLKFSLISLIRKGWMNVEQAMVQAIESENNNRAAVSLNEDARKEAITKLHYLCTLHNPYEMIDCSVHIVRLLTTSEFDKHHFTSLGADDLVPRLCLVVVDSRLAGLGAEAKFMETFMPSEKALGEEGYAVTMIQSSVAHLTSLDV